MPRPGSRVIPVGWEAHHRPVAEGTMTARCRITRAGAGQGTWNDTTKQYDPPTRQVVYETLACRVQELSMPRVQEAGQQRVSSRDYRVVVPITAAAVLINDWVEVTGGDPTLDPSLIGRHLVITDVQRGSLTWERDLVAIDNLG
jgi:hypothetical protein